MKFVAKKFAAKKFSAQKAAFSHTKIGVLAIDILA